MSNMKEPRPETLDRLSMRSRPDGAPLMSQTWGKLLFMHWRIDREALRPLIPEPLSIDTFDGSAWIAVTPFTMWNVRLSFAPPLPGLSSLHELNVRTYVHMNGVPGVWFFSLDANSRPAVVAARTFYHLPYFHAEIALEQEGTTINYDLARTDDPPAEFHASWKTGGNARFAHPDTLEFFLVERYCLYAQRGDRLMRARIHHEPWPLRDAELLTLDSTMIESHGLPTPAGEPLLHYAEELDVDIWGPEEV
jgi:uncharacterized protein YqjF (DUF2071 family)